MLRVSFVSLQFNNSFDILRLVTTKEKSSLTGPEIFVVVFSHVKKEDSVKK